MFASSTPSTPTAAMSPADKLKTKRKSILDSVRSSFDKVSTRMGSADKARLQAHADQIRQFELSLDTVVKQTCSSPKLNPTGVMPANFEQGEGRSDDVIAGTHIDLIATALACQSARVATLHFSNIQNNTFPFLNGGKDFVTGGWHPVVHGDSGTDDQRTRAMAWYLKVFGDLVTKLTNTPEGTGNLMDNTVVMFTSSLRQSYHGTTDLPVLLAGNLGGKIKTGRMIKYTNKTTGDLFTTLLNLFDVPATSFGWNKGSAGGRPFNNGPLPSWA
jgi:hypothetical protein